MSSQPWSEVAPYIEMLSKCVDDAETFGKKLRLAECVVTNPRAQVSRKLPLTADSLNRILDQFRSVVSFGIRPNSPPPPLEEPTEDPAAEALPAQSAADAFGWFYHFLDWRDRDVIVPIAVCKALRMLH